MNELKRYLVGCGGIDLSEDSGGAKYLELEYREEFRNKNVRIKLNQFVNSIYKLNDRCKDLLEIAGYLFAADRKSARGAKNLLEYHSWSRIFDVHIEVRDLEFWEQDEIQQKLNAALKFMTGDHEYKFNFYKLNNDIPYSLFDNEKFNIDTDDNLRIVLFSGGLDSLAGVLETLNTTEDKILLVSHQSGQNGIINIQEKIFEQLNLSYPQRCNHYKFKCGLSAEQSKDETQRTRSFLYTSIAFVIANTYGKDKIYVYENGVTSTNFPETQDLMNARSSRTTHPQTLSLMEELFSIIAERKFNITNEFIFKTKTDIVNIVKEYDGIGLLNSTVSCSASRIKSTKFSHCGKCFQCIDRKFAVYAAEAEKYDETGIYEFKFLKHSLDDNETIKLLNEYIRNVKNILNQSFKKFVEKRMYELEEVEDYIDGETEDERLQKLYDLFQRNAKQVEQAIIRMREIHDSPLKMPKKNSFFEVILGARTYLNDEKDDIERSLDELLDEETKNGGFKLRKFRKGELRRELEKYVEEYDLEKYDTVPSSTIELIKNQLIQKGFDANYGSVAAVLRKMDYSYSYER